MGDVFPSPCGEKIGNNFNVKVEYVDFEGFPSPCGEKIGNNLSKYKSIPLQRLPFPSPCGEKIGNNYKRKTKG
ncbi:conserved hypothetical protein [Planktothrix serta PCC 8927]|uniref:Uncharacterized protein n=1 Tax=Planktothrix serta PCC 8927 TaxID=671068 RepID=A0A7Z9BME5_9CYAN|nr:conserved hypothetical protein [Planktothrix serta PCC 8927]